MKLQIDKSLAIRAASILYTRWIYAPMPGDKTRPMGGMNPVYATEVYLKAVAKITGLSTEVSYSTRSVVHTIQGI